MNHSSSTFPSLTVAPAPIGRDRRKDGSRFRYRSPRSLFPESQYGCPTHRPLIPNNIFSVHVNVSCLGSVHGGSLLRNHRHWPLSNIENQLYCSIEQAAVENFPSPLPSLLSNNVVRCVVQLSVTSTVLITIQAPVIKPYKNILKRKWPRICSMGIRWGHAQPGGALSRRRS